MKSILLVDDSESCLLLYDTILTKKGYNVIKATNGEEAINKALNGHDISLILMDIKMPIINGIEATKKIKANQDIPIIAMSAFSLNSLYYNSQIHYQRDIFNDYLVKPLNSSDLLNIIQKYIK